MVKILSGVYMIKNIKNNKAYIGISIDIFRRWKEHLYNAFSLHQHNKLYNALRKYGLINFSFQILELTEDIRRECYWIEYYDSIRHGYNIRSGGDIMKYENSPRHKLTLQEVRDIRTRYMRGERKKYVYSLYRDKISFSGFEKIWLNINWVGIMPEAYARKKK